MYRSFTINVQFLIKKRRKLVYTPNNFEEYRRLMNMRIMILWSSSFT